MAGIGFELRKLFMEEKEQPFGNIKALIFSAAISVGPWLITSTSLNLLILISENVKVSRVNQIIFMSSIFYTFIFSQILTSIFQYLITRFVSDCIFQKRIGKIRGTFLGSMKLLSILAFFASYLFIRNGNLSVGFKVVFILLFISMCLSWITMIFVSLLKKYHFILFSFFLGNIVSVVLGYYFLKFPVTFIKETPIFWMMLSYCAGIFLNFLLTSMYVLRAFKGNGKNQFEFLTYLRGYFSLIIIGAIYILGVWAHVFMNWLVGDSYVIANAFIISPLYEVAVFYSYCTAIPSIIYFTIFLETKFLPLYKEYYKKISRTGTYKEIQDALEIMKQTLYREILYCMELQFLISLTCILLSNVIFNQFDMDARLLELFRITIFGSFCAIFVSILITLFLYFDLRLQSIILSFTLLISNIVFTYMFGRIGTGFAGTGFFLASFLTFGVAIYMFPKIFDTLNYTTMFRQNFNQKTGGATLKKVSLWLDKKVYILIILVLLFILGGKANAAYDKRGFNPVTRNNWHTMSPFDKDGYDIEGYTKDGINKRGFNRLNWNELTNSPYDYAGFDYNEIHKDTKKNYDERGFNINLYNVLTNSNYDKRGFSHQGIHKDTKREYDENGWNYYGLHEQTKDYYNPEGWNWEGINKRGFNKEGMNVETKSRYDNMGFDMSGIHKDTKKNYDERGFDINLHNIKTNSLYDERGFNYAGIHKDTKREYDENGWNYYGLHEQTKDYYNPEGLNWEGIDKKGFDKNGWNTFTKSKYDYAGFDIKGIHKNTKKKYDERGFDNNQFNVQTKSKYDKYGFNYEGIHKDTGRKYDKNGWNFYGLNEKTKTFYNTQGYTREGLDKYGYKKGQRPANFDDGVYDKNGFNKKGIYMKGY